ncbi:MAG: hypothetical protein MUE44_35005 [Oscillatoriaceae cyanobacterium Prado104]|nr:hypothetical protein [Oscillatoriaceae cyanobacterium Prado104]
MPAIKKACSADFSPQMKRTEVRTTNKSDRGQSTGHDMMRFSSESQFGND